MAVIDETTLTRVLVGGKPVGFTKSTGLLHLAGDDLTLEQWQELERRVNLFFHRNGQATVTSKGSDSNAGSSTFLTRNLREILARDIGLIAQPPWWLRWKYSAVVGKEILWE